MATEQNPGLYHFSGMYGEARDATGQLLSEVVEVSGTVEIARIDMPLVGQTRSGFKPGRESRTGTLRLQKIDTSWEMKVYDFLSQSLEDRRRARDRGEQSIRPFTITFEYDDPDAVGIEKWKLEGCMIWSLPLGFSITDDTVERDYPLTWEREVPIYAFAAKRTTTPAGTVLSPNWYTAPPPVVA